MLLEDSLVEVFAPNGKAPVGAGLLVEQDLVLTCAHVVNSALGRDVREVGRPDGEVSIQFPQSGSIPFRASVDKEAEAWSDPPATKQLGADLSLLRLRVAGKGLPAKLWDFENLIGRKFRAAGFPQDWKGDLDIAEGKIVGRSQGLYLLRQSAAAAILAMLAKIRFLGGQYRPAGVIHSGFSGGPVEVAGKIVGLLAEARSSVWEVTAYMIPVSAFPKCIARNMNTFVDDFKDGAKYWPLVDRSNEYWKDHTAIFKNTYHWEITALKGVTARLSSNAPAVSDFDLHAELRLIHGASVVYGFFFRQSDEGGYYFLLSDAGKYGFNIWLRKSGEIKHKILDWVSSPAIRPQGTNNLRIIAQGPTINLYINDNLVVDIVDVTLTSGQLGLAAQVNEGQSAVIEMSSFKMVLLDETHLGEPH